MMLDFDRQVMAFSSQPFWLSWTEEAKIRRHVPDYFARLADGTAVVIDVRADDQIPAKDAEVLEMTGRACASVGWDYRRVGVVDPVLAVNVRWLAGCRHLRCLDQGKDEDRVTTADDSPQRPLPIRPRPMTGESQASYLRRLARANHLRPAYLHRHLRQPGTPDTIRLDWLAILAGRSLPALERALTGHQTSARQHVRQAEKPALFAAIRRDARDNGLSIRALADRHGVHRRTVRQALASPWPAPRKTPQRRSRLDPFKGVIDTMLSAPRAAGKAPFSARQIHARLVREHGMTSVSYSTVRSYVAGCLPARQPSAWDTEDLRREAQQAIMHLKEALEAMQPGIADRSQPHLDAVQFIIRQAPGRTEADARNAQARR